MTRHKSALRLFGAMALGLVLTVPMQGSDASLKTNFFTFQQSVSLPGAELPPGTYIFEHVTATDPDVIVVRSGDRAQVYYLGFTNRLNRPRNVGRGSAITLGEARPGAAPPIAAWYPPDSSRGHGLIYR